MADLGPIKIDRGRYWGSKSTGTKIAAAISLMLVSYAHAKSGKGGTNPAMKMMIDAVDNDVRDQITEYKSQVNAVGRKQSLYGYFRQRLGDDLRAEKAATMRSYSQLEEEIKLSGARSQGDKVQQKVNESLAMLAIKKAEAAKGFGKVSISDQIAMDKRNRIHKDSIVVIGGKPYMTKDPETAQKARGISSNVKLLRREMTALKHLASSVSFHDFIPGLPTETNTKIEAANANIRDHFAKMVNSGGGQLSDEDNKRIDALLRSYSSTFSTRDWTDYMGATKLAEVALNDFMGYAERRSEAMLTGLIGEYGGSIGLGDSSGIRSGDYRGRK
jgi:hypothetical protein